jgi:hypothetical protein
MAGWVNSWAWTLNPTSITANAATARNTDFVAIIEPSPVLCFAPCFSPDPSLHTIDSSSPAQWDIRFFPLQRDLPERLAQPRRERAGSVLYVRPNMSRLHGEHGAECRNRENAGTATWKDEPHGPSQRCILTTRSVSEGDTRIHPRSRFGSQLAAPARKPGELGNLHRMCRIPTPSWDGFPSRLVDADTLST